MENNFLNMKAPCAALAFHKSLIGISQLDALEKASISCGISKFYTLKAIYTYYVVYHVFCACMLLLPEEYVGKLKTPTNYGNVKDDYIDNSSETPDQWNNSREYESDWATMISHQQIKMFCKKLRLVDKKELNSTYPYLLSLYKYFVDDTDSEHKCISGLYEKLCYIRDRVIYRPSYVKTESGRIVQTSAKLGEEIYSLPSAAILYGAAVEIYNGIIDCMRNERQNGGPCHHIAMLSEMWNGRVIEDLEDLCKIGHKRRRLQYLGTREEDGRYNYPTYVAHLLEIESIDFIRKYKKEYWMPLERIYQEDWLNYQEQKI